MAAPTLAQLRTSVRERAHLSANDPFFPNDVVSRQINMAYGDVMTSVQPNGWWFQHFEQTVQNTAGDLAQMPVVLGTPDNTRAIRKVYSVFASLDGNYWLPIGQRERTDQIRLAGGRRVADGLPLSWTALPSVTTAAGARRQLVIVFDPPLPNLAYVRYMGVIDPADLAGDSDQIVALPPQVAELVVEGAVVALLGQQRVVGRLSTRRRYITKISVAKDAYAGWLRAARLYYNAAAAGAGTATQRDRRGP